MDRKRFTLLSNKIYKLDKIYKLEKIIWPKNGKVLSEEWGSVLNIWPPQNIQQIGKNADTADGIPRNQITGKTDAEALRGDWEKVGMDIEKTMGK